MFILIFAVQAFGEADLSADSKNFSSDKILDYCIHNYGVLKEASTSATMVKLKECFSGKIKTFFKAMSIKYPLADSKEVNDQCRISRKCMNLKYLEEAVRKSHLKNKEIYEVSKKN